ncbi:very long chain fatty acid elongase 5-like [Ptychodera flava]|uniref:very long chain fatty acid elongase 5-like n=1 Tax=Ptychodera flava TaxID=63121 RepID=UPI003969D3C0
MARFTTHQVIVTFLGLKSAPLMMIYLLMVLLSKYYHRYTSPLSLKPILILYNLTCSLVSLYTLCGFIYGMYESNSVFQKQATPTLEHFFFIYFCTKTLELLDTVFMILRHRSRQISFLHVYHHASMLLLSDFSYNYCPWPAIAFGLSINSFVHVCLYLYYAQTAYDSTQAPSWKKNMTQLQIAQFLGGLVHNTMGYLYHGFCVYSFFYAFTMLYLFSNFYYHAFIKTPSKRKNKVDMNYESKNGKLE